MSDPGNVVHMERCHRIIAALVSVDARGGIVSQVSLSEAIKNVLASDGLSHTYYHASDPTLTDADKIRMGAYRIRCMMAHMRAKIRQQLCVAILGG